MRKIVAVDVIIVDNVGQNILKLAIFLGIDLQAAVSKLGACLVTAKLNKYRLFCDVGCPREFDLEACSVVEFDEAHSKVLDVEYSVCLLISEGRVNGIGKVAVCKLGVCASRNCNGSGVTHEPDCKVDHMNAEVDERTATGLLFSGKPTALAGDSATALPSATSAIYLTHLTVGNILLKILCGFTVAIISHYHKMLAALLSRCLHLECFLDGNCIGLFTENVNAFLKRINGYYRVHIVGGANINVIKSFNFKKLLVVNK